jgi:hypothetical protein
MEPWTDLPRHAGELAQLAAAATARGFPVRAARPDFARLAAAASEAARDCVFDRLAPALRSAVDDPVLSARMNAAWRYRWRHHSAGQARSAAVADAYLRDRRIEIPEAALTIAQRGLSLPPPPAPLGWAEAWLDGWMTGWARVGRPAGRRGDSIDEDWAALLEGAGEQAAASALDRAWRLIAGTVIESRRLAIYGAWVGVAQFYAGPPVEDALLWRRLIRGFWRPFYEQATAGLGWCWFAPDAVVCLPRPAIRRLDGGVLAEWPNGEQTSIPQAQRARQ